MKYIKKIFVIFVIFILLSLYTYVCNIELFPKELILKQGEILDLKAIYGITLNKENEVESVLQTSSNLNKNKVNEEGPVDAHLNLFGKVPLKNVKLNVIPETMVIPIGDTVGMKLYTEGVLVVGKSEINRKKTI